MQGTAALHPEEKTKFPKFYVPRMPTAEEHRAASLSWLGVMQPTLIDQWPAEVAALSMPTELMPIDANQVRASLFDRHGHEPMSEGAVQLAAELDSRLGWKRKFIKLNSRSPKDALWPLEVPITCSGKEAVLMLMNSERVLDDLTEFKYAPEQPAFICLRDVAFGIRPENEFRCFMKDGELIAVSHYDYTKPMPAPADEGAAIRGHIDEWFRETLKPRLHMTTVVFDVSLGREDTLLIELNPYGLSDPCHFGSYQEVERASVPVAFAGQSRPEGTDAAQS